MEIADYSKERSRLITVVLTLVVIGLSLLASTWQTMSHQKDAEEQHLFLSTRAVLLAVESSLRRGPLRAGDDRLTSRTEEFFQALEQDGDILFVGLIDPAGGRLLTSSVRGGNSIELPTAMLATLFQNGEWHGRLVVSKRSAYVYGKKLSPARAGGSSLFGEREDVPEEEEALPVFLLVGIDMEKHLGAYRGLRKNVLFQAAYILAAAIFTWTLGLSLLARREQARKAAALERFQVKLLDNLPDGLITLDSTRTIRSANPAALAILGYAPGRLVGRSVTALPDAIGKALTQSAKASIASHQESDDDEVSAWQRVTVNNKHLEVLVLPLADDEDTAWLLIVRDRTRMLRLEKSLADAEKLAAIGSLAAGVAHEVRNPLSSLRGFAQYFVKKLQGSQPEEEYAKTMVREADRLNRVITDLLFLARPKPIEPKPIPLKALITEIQSLLRFDLEQKGLSLATKLGAVRVYADEDSLKQALLNLMLNSLDALSMDCMEKLPQGAEPPLEIASGNTPDGTWIEVRDRGCGMTEEQRDQAFEAFFTAKTHGTGLGLALVQRTMLDHDGRASITSAPGKGTTVRLFFPSQRTAETARPHAEEPLPLAEPAQPQKPSPGPSRFAAFTSRRKRPAEDKDSTETGSPGNTEDVSTATAAPQAKKASGLFRRKKPDATPRSDT